MKERLIISLGNSVFRDKNEKTLDVLADKIIKLSSRFDIAVVFDSEVSEPALSLALKNASINHNLNKGVVSLSVQPLVNKTDPRFKTPSEFTGPEFSYYGALKIAKEKGWVMKKDGEKKYRHFVPSVLTSDILEKREISELLLGRKIVLVRNSNPVYRTKVLKLLRSAEAVVDRDRVAEKIAEATKADYFVCLSDVSEVCLNYKTEAELKLRFLTPEEVKRYSSRGQFDADSIGRKLAACSKFAKKKRTAVICSVKNLEDSLKSTSGTIIS